jgi:glyoxylase-like metal-dependent hydrolase (beta-lactamase superfamily II)
VSNLRQGAYRSSWFRVARLGRGVFLLSERLDFCPAYETGTVNSYLIVGGKRALLLDTGMGIGDIAAEARRLTPLDVVVVNSHAHWDHIGGNSAFEDIRIHATEAGALEIPVSLPEVAEALVQLERDRTGTAPTAFEPHCISPSRATATLTDGEIIDLGDRTVRVLHTPGHSPGSLALHDERTGFLFTADTVYDGVIWLLGDAAAGEAAVDTSFLRTSIEKLRDLKGRGGQPPTALLPGHETTPLDPGFLDRLARALDQVTEAAARDPNAGEPWSLAGYAGGPLGRKLRVGGLDFLVPLPAPHPPPSSPTAGAGGG